MEAHAGQYHQCHLHFKILPLLASASSSPVPRIQIWPVVLYIRPFFSDDQLLIEDLQILSRVHLAVLDHFRNITRITDRRILKFLITSVGRLCFKLSSPYPIVFQTLFNKLFSLGKLAKIKRLRTVLPKMQRLFYPSD